MILGNDVSADFDAFLVKLHDAQSVLSLAREKTPEAFKQLSDIIVEAMDGDMSHSEAELAADILVDLAKKLQKNLRKGLAARLAHLESVPLRLALYLANDEIEVAEEFLQNSPALNDTDLYYIVQGQGPEHWAAIAKRKGLAPEVINLLAEKYEYYTSRNLLNNKEIDLTIKALNTLKNFVAEHKDLIRQFVQRQEITHTMVTELYWQVNAEERQMIATLCDPEMVPDDVDTALQDTMTDFQNITFGSLTITAEMQDIAQKTHERGLLNLNKLVTTLKDGQIGLFYAMFSVYSGISMDNLDRIFLDKDGKALAIVCKNLGFDRSVFVAFFVQTRKARKVKEVMQQNALYKALAFYNKITQAEAQKLVSTILKNAS